MAILNFELRDKTYISGNIEYSTINEICKGLTIYNPQIDKLEKLGKYTGDIERWIKYFTYNQGGGIKGGLVFPRGYAASAYKICEKHYGKDKINLLDNRLELPPIEFEFKGRLRPFQVNAIKVMLKQSDGIIVFPTGAGKTVTMLNLIAQRKQPALVIVDKKELLYQWEDRAGQFLNINHADIGIIGNGKFQVGDTLTIGTIQTIAKHIDSLKNKFGMVIVDECHKVGADTFRNTISQFTAKYIHGCTATPIRNDGQTEAIFLYLGKVKYEIDKEHLLDNGYLCNARYKQIATNFDSWLDATLNYTGVISELIEDTARNELVCKTILEHQDNGLNLILTNRVNHCQTIKHILYKQHQINSEILTGSLSKRERARIFELITQSRVKNIIATTSLLKEGFDLPALQNLFIVAPVKWEGAVIQMVGRILRPSADKEYALIIDFVDSEIGVLKHSGKVRARVYEEQNIREVI